MARVSAVFILFFISGGAGSAADPDVLQVAARHSAAAEALLPFTCHVEQVTHVDVGPLGRVTAGTYWRSPDAVRSRVKLGGTIIDMMVKDGQTRSYSLAAGGPNDYGGGKAIGSSGRTEAGSKTPHADVWSLALLTLGDGTFDRRSVEGWVKSARRSTARSETVEGRPLVRIDVPAVRAEMVFWLDPAANYLVRRAEVAQKNEDIQDEYIAEGFAEVGPGIHFPTVCRLTVRKAGVLTTKGWAAKFTKVSAGKPLPADAFAFKFPAGLLVLDVDADKVSRTDARGEPGLPATDAKGQPRLHSSAPLPPETPERPAEPQRATEAEPTRRSAWLLPAGLGLIGIAVVLWLVRRGLRPARPSPS